MTYLIKTEDGKTHHFRVTVTNNGVDIVHGVFYNWMGKYFEGCGNETSANKRQIQLVEEKRKEGFQITEFKETLENTVHVYDQAKYHYSGDFPADLDEFQGFVHTGMFLGWLVDSDLVSDEFKIDQTQRIEAFKLKKLTGSQIFEEGCDGTLMLDNISEQGNRFALPYFDFETGQYLADYEKTLAGKLPSLYHVADSWENYAKLKQVLDKRYSDWKGQKSKKSGWKFW
jgi:hypothetical protein